MTARKLKDKATQLFSKGKYEKAAEVYSEYCKVDPKDHQARLRMGDAWVRAGEKQRAIEAYQGAAEGYAKEGFLPRAIAASKLILELDPGHTSTQKMLATLYSEKSGKGRSSSGSGLRPAVAPPSPTNRPDAIEIDESEEPALEVNSGAADHSTVGGHRAERGPSPMTRLDAIEIDTGPADTGREALTETVIELDLGSQPTTGEVEIPIEGIAIEEPPPAPPPSPPAPVPSAPIFELTVEADPPAPVPPRATELQIGDDAPAPTEAVESGPRVYELDLESQPDESLASPPPADEPPGPRVFDLSEEAASPPPPPDDVPAVSAFEVADTVETEAVAPGERTFSLDDTVESAPEASPPRSSDSSVEGGLPPGLRPRKAAAPAPVASSEAAPDAPGSSRIWVPPAFKAPRAEVAPAPPQAPPQWGAPAADVDASSELERSLSAFTRFDPDAPEAAPAPAPRPATPSVSFTELELEGDSLLHAVEAAAARGSPAPVAGAIEEELLESPEDTRPGADGLPHIPLFSDLPEDAFLALFDRCPLRRFTTNDLIFGQGSQGTSFFVICAGKARVFRMEGEHRREIVTLDEGEFFGEMALLSEAPRSASVEAADEDTQLLEISAQVLAELSAQHPAVARALRKFCRLRLLSNIMNTAPIFRPFGKNDRRELVQRFRARDVVKGDVLISAGQSSDGLYVVLSGEVEVRVGAQAVARLREGQVFGEMSLLTRSAATADVVAARHTSILRLPAPDFDALIMSHPQILELVSELTDERRRQNAALLNQKADGTSSMV